MPPPTVVGSVSGVVSDPLPSEPNSLIPQHTALFVVVTPQTSTKLDTSVFNGGLCTVNGVVVSRDVKPRWPSVKNDDCPQQCAMPLASRPHALTPPAAMT